MLNMSSSDMGVEEVGEEAGGSKRAVHFAVCASESNFRSA
jgi:hypothetical protein